VAVAMVALVAGTAIGVRAAMDDAAAGGGAAGRPPHNVAISRVLPARSQSYLGIYSPQAPGSYAGIASFARATGVTPTVAMYFSGWLEPFQVDFALAAERNGAVPLVQMDPSHVSLAGIANGEYDAYLGSYADAVRSFRSAVIISFGHEMNGSWYSWGYQHESPADFIKAWRHIVSVFRAAGADNVTWLWTVNIVSNGPGGHYIPSPAAWWPGSSYVTWVGIDGYYLQPSWRFVSLFGPTIGIVRNLTSDPILISETGAAEPDQPVQIADLAAGIRTYGLLGFIWFDATGQLDWAIEASASVAAFRSAARPYRGAGQ
jgi:mannan endo-1,4-beta-mannosidase